MAVADEVDSLVERSPLAPILLFNEADGILIATTNLTQNLDPAFERRILRPERRPDRKRRAQIRHQRHPLRR